jgi:hypothetical protein
MGLTRRVAESLSDEPTPEDEVEIKAHLRNSSMLMGGMAVFFADVALAYSADSWQADVLAVPTGVAGLLIAGKGYERVIDWMNSDATSGSSIERTGKST